MTDTEDINHTFVTNIHQYHENPSCLEILYLICHTKNTFEIDIGDQFVTVLTKVMADFG